MREKRLRESDLEFEITVGDDYEGLFAEFNKIRINYIHNKLFDPNYDQNKPTNVLGQIRYHSNLIWEAREFLKTTKYNGLEIFVDENVNWEVLAILQEKHNSGEKWTKLERIIADVACFSMGGLGGSIDISNDPDYKRAEEIFDARFNTLTSKLLSLSHPISEKKYIESINYILDDIIRSDDTLAPYRSYLMLEAKKRFERLDDFNLVKKELRERGIALTDILKDVFQKGDHHLRGEFEIILQYGSDMWDSDMDDFNVEKCFNQIRTSNAHQSFEFLAQLFRDFFKNIDMDN